MLLAVRVDAPAGGISILTIMNEIWETIPNTERPYEVSSLGRVRRKAFSEKMKNGKIRVHPERTQKLSSSGTSVIVSIDGKTKSVPLLVLNAFVPNPYGYKTLYHVDGNIENNTIENLRWGSREKVSLDVLYPNETEKDYLWRHYLITKKGEIVRRSDNMIISSSYDAKGYLTARLKVPPFSKHKDRRKQYKIHRLVAMFYLDDYSEDLQVNHKNGIKSDNRVENLEMVTNAQNALHAWNVLDSEKRREMVRESNRRRSIRH